VLPSARPCITGVTNGAGWYPIYSSLQDWSYTAADCLEITLELSQAKYPATSYLKTMWADNLNALLTLPTLAVLGGVSGRVVAADTGAPLAGAVVSIDGIAKSTKTRGATGAFTKPLAPGSYTVHVTAPGFRTATTTVVVPTDGSGAAADFTLVRSARLAARRAAGHAAVVEAAAAVDATVP
jgi:carboxypeptidase D